MFHALFSGRRKVFLGIARMPAYHGDMEIAYNVQIWKEGAQFIAHAMPLDVASSGASPDDARHALDEAVHLFLRTAADHGTLVEVLEDAGYEKRGSDWRSPDWVALERHQAVMGV